MVRTFIQVTAISLALAASFFLVKSGIGMSVTDIFELSHFGFGGYNPQVVTNLTQQKGDITVGFILLLATYSLSLINLFLPMYCDEFTVNRKGLILALVVSAVVFIGAYVTSYCLQKKWYRQVQQMERKVTSELVPGTMRRLVWLKM